MGIDLSNMDENIQFEKALQKSFRYLTFRQRSEKEVREKLREKGFAEPVIEKVLARLYELKYIDDKVFAVRWACYLAENRRYSNRRIEADLKSKGAPAEAIAEALKEARKAMPERDVIGALIRKKTKGKMAEEMDWKERRRITQSLVGKGFSLGLVFEMMGEHVESEGE